MVERLFIRLVVTVALCLALIASALAPVPTDDLGQTHLPAPALGQIPLYRLEVALFVFYGCLLLATPVFSGLLRARLPIEISTRGAKFAEEADETAADTEASIRAVEKKVTQLTQGLRDAQIEIESLQLGSSDSTQQEVGSGR